MALGEHQIRKALEPFGVSVDAALARQIATYVDTLLFWNQKVSLTSAINLNEILERHFGESMFGAQLIDQRQGTLVDVGSGAGFPGLALKLVCPGLRVLLVEPVLKKAVFLSEVIRALGLSGAEVLRMRAEEATVEADWITSRAVAVGPDLLSWAHQALLDSGRILLWTSEAGAAEVSAIGGWEWGEPLRVPRSDRRLILSGVPRGTT